MKTKSWHIVVLDGWKQIKDIEKFDVKESKELYDQLKAEYAESHPHYVVKREQF